LVVVATKRADLGFQFLALIFQPFLQAQRRQAVVPVVALDGLEKIADFFLTVPRPSPLHRTGGGVGVPERHCAGEAIEWFEPLDGVALHRGANALRTAR